MSSITRHINIISRCAGLYRTERLKDSDLGQNHHRYIFCICRHPGISQEELSRRVYINKSNVTRHLSYLEKNGYVERRQSEEDKRVTLVFPTEKANAALPALREIVHPRGEGAVHAPRRARGNEGGRSHRRRSIGGMTV